MMENKKEGTKPYEDCEHCEFKDNRCHVDNRFQRLPRSEGGLGMCIKIGGHGC